MDSDRISATTAHLFEENGPYFFLLTILLMLGLALLWTLFAGAGRALTLRQITGRPVRIFNIALAQAFRAGVTVFCVLFFFGVLYLAAYLSTTSEGEVHVALYAVLALLDTFVSALLWVTGNWVFWLASITAGVHDRFFGAKPSIFSEARRLARDKEHLDLEIAFGLPRTVLFLIVFVVSLIPTVMLLRSGGVLLSVLLSLLTLTYLAAADVLQIARVTAIVNLAASGTKHQTSAPAMS